MEALPDRAQGEEHQTQKRSPLLGSMQCSISRGARRSAQPEGSHDALASHLFKRAQWRLDRLALNIRSAAARATMVWRIRTGGRQHPLPGELVVSLTSYPPRFATLPLTLRSLLCQTVKPDRIVLWVSHDDEPIIPEAVRRLTSYGVEIRTTDDIKSFKKIIPAVRAFPDAFIVTADDDVYYGPHWLENLTLASSGRMGLIVCYQAREIQRDDQGKLQPYERWPYLSEPRDSATAFPVGRGGILYPPGALSSELVDEAAFLELCPQADDVWLYWMGRRAGSTFRKIQQSEGLWDWPGSQKTALFRENLLASMNDRQIDAVAKRYGYPDF